MFYNILDKKRKAILPLLKNFKKDFYLAGGTALALQIGHRDSVDFDFFSQKDINTIKLFQQIKKVFSEHKILKVQEEINTLTVLIDDKVKLSFFTYKYKLIKKIVVEKYLRLASLEDIACMKLNAIISRATLKDYIDLYFILHRVKFKHLLKIMKKKYLDIDINLVLKSLIYFEDIKKEPIKFKNKMKVDFENVKKFLIKEVKEIIIN